MGTSTHNSQVIHAGIYYPKGSLKGRHCVRWCEDDVRILRDARRPVPALRQADRRARRRARFQRSRRSARRAQPTASRASKIVDAAFVRRREPNVHAVAAILSPNSGILEAEALVRTLARLRSRSRGDSSLPGTSVVDGEPHAEAIEIVTPSERIHARSVVNAAGLYADEVSAALGGSPFRI